MLAAVNGKVPVLVDSGFRRGSDIVKALAMGARACASAALPVGPRGVRPAGRRARARPPAGELRAAMMQVGAPSLKDLVPAMVRRA